MSSPGSVISLYRLALFALAFGLLGARAGAQEQERKLLDRIEHPNMDLHAEGFSKSFETKASAGDRQAVVHPFSFGGRTANVKTGDGAFHARSFDDGRGSFRTENFTVKRATLVEHQALPQADRTFATSAVPVREDRVAHKSVDSRDYVDSTKPYLIPGKRQDSIDELRRNKNLTIDQVREILNKSK